jgi:hypothetical protein
MQELTFEQVEVVSGGGGILESYGQYLFWRSLLGSGDNDSGNSSGRDGDSTLPGGSGEGLPKP